jgi:transcriptional regulator with XRE-family HTH domain
MKRGIQNEIADKVDISTAFISQILSGKRRPSWSMAKKLSKATNTKPELWLEAAPEKIKEVLDAVNF